MGRPSSAIGGGAGRLRLLLWRRRVPLTVLWLASLAAVAGALWFYHARVPVSVDTGITVTLRQVAYRDTFQEMDRARRDVELAAQATDPDERARLEDRAEQRLELFLTRHRSVQPDRLETHAVVAATELLADVYRGQSKSSKAARLLAGLAAHVPLNYRLHQLTAEALAESGDTAAAAVAYREAFKLAPNHPAVADGYLRVLSVLNAFDDIVWVADQFDAAVRRGAPSVEVKVGPARDALQRRVLEWSGVPVEHGSYVRATTVFGLDRGPLCTLAPPRDLLADWTHGGPLFVQLRFEGIYEELTVHGFRYRTRGGVDRELPLDAERLSTFHRPHSGVEYYVEFRTDLDPRDIAWFEVDYGCPLQELRSSAQQIVAKARANAGVGGGPR